MTNNGSKINHRFQYCDPFCSVTVVTDIGDVRKDAHQNCREIPENRRHDVPDKQVVNWAREIIRVQPIGNRVHKITEDR